MSATDLALLASRAAAALAITPASLATELESAREKITRGLRRLAEVSDEDLAIAKKRREVTTALTVEQTAMVAPQLALWWSSAGMDYYLTYDDRMNAQTLDSLRQFARAYVAGRPRVIGVLGAPTVVDALAAWLRAGGRKTTP